MQIFLTPFGPKRWSKLARFTTCSRTRALASLRTKSCGKCLHSPLIDTKFSAASLRTTFRKKLALLNRCGINELIERFTLAQTRNRDTRCGISGIGGLTTRTIARSWKTNFQPPTTSPNWSGIKDVVAARNESRCPQRLSQNHYNLQNRWNNPSLIQSSSNAAPLLLLMSQTRLNRRLTMNRHWRKRFQVRKPQNGNKLCWRSSTASTKMVFGS